MDSPTFPFICSAAVQCASHIHLVHDQVKWGIAYLAACFEVPVNLPSRNFSGLLSCTGAKDPKALETLVKSMNVKTESVNRDLTAYKGILSKLSAAKELMAELMAREKRKQEER